jgi:hypothetical protein
MGNIFSDIQYYIARRQGQGLRNRTWLSYVEEINKFIYVYISSTC